MSGTSFHHSAMPCWLQEHGCGVAASARSIFGSWAPHDLFELERPICARSAGPSGALTDRQWGRCRRCHNLPRNDPKEGACNKVSVGN
jgi:hypothetical protein